MKLGPLKLPLKTRTPYYLPLEIDYHCPQFFDTNKTLITHQAILLCKLRFT